ncbi:Phenylalanine--tRNA ligase beta subunit [Thalassoglobus neptunius]|uniref:phenylalanine--tRNA ligase n=1 Tax=Thalassoglobus neptunius TaxID=1938619 RepID=A0A5C5WGH1_9PLAN|nr:phenylalanine--tRNA ligase subunit beta [Thalassoglobus neptunius]TWT49896.1 Phenylalanine--tRNA ligase beta subunit [Thalassoglobus neptunius]
MRTLFQKRLKPGVDGVPVINVEGEWLNKLLGKEYAVEELADTLEQIGCDVEDIVTVERFRCPVCGNAVEGSLGADVTRRCNWCEHEQEQPFERIGESQVIRLDLLAARPDLFDVGGIARALKGYFEEVVGLPKYDVGTSDLELVVDPSVDGEDCQRPFIRCAIVEMEQIDDATLVALMKLQEALHWGVGRDRKLASIGVYDLDQISGPLQYTTIDPDSERFEPLGRPGEQMTGREILEKHPKGTAYAKLLEDHRRFPVLKDSKGVVLSMPPIINSESTKVSQNSRRLFIDVTGISESAVVKSLDTFVSSLLEMGGTAKSVSVKPLSGETFDSPDLSPREVEIDLESANRWLGLPLDQDSLKASLNRMRLDVTPVDGSDSRFTVRYPALRTDFKHMVDVFEDLAIGYGYKNIVPSYAGQATTGQSRPEDDQSDMFRSVMLGLGYGEIMSLPMTTEELHFEKFKLPVPDSYPKIANPKLKAMTVVRTHLMTGVMEHLRENRRAPLPLRFFELDNVTVLDSQAETGAREERHLAIVEMGKDASYASIRSVIDSLMFEIGATATFESITHPSFIPGRVAAFETDSEVRGVLGELHPEVILNFGLDHPVALAELTVSKIDV